MRDLNRQRVRIRPKALMRREGLTLIEIMVVVIILGTIASLVAVNVMGQLEKANIETTRVQMQTFKQALDLFKMDNGFYPETEQGLQALVMPPATGRQPRRYNPSGYLQGEVPLDPWGQPYGYASQGYSFQVFSAGPDGQLGTGDDIQG